MTRSRILLGLALVSAVLAGTGLMSHAAAQQPRAYTNEDLLGEHIGAFESADPSSADPLGYIHRSAMGRFTFDGVGGGTYDYFQYGISGIKAHGTGNLAYTVNSDGSGELTLLSGGEPSRVFDIQIVSATKRGADILLNQNTATLLPGETAPLFATGIGHLMRH